MNLAATRNSAQTVGQGHPHAASFARIVEGRKQPVRGLWQRQGRFSPQSSVEDFSTGQKRRKGVPLMKLEDEPAESVAQAIAAIHGLRPHRSEDALPTLGRTPTLSTYADACIAKIKAGHEKKDSTMEKAEIYEASQAHGACIAASKLQAELASLSGQLQQLQNERDQGTNVAAELRTENGGSAAGETVFRG